MEPSDELRRTLLSLYEAVSSGDADAVEAHYSLQDGGIFVGTDEAEFWTESAQHNADVRRFFDGSQGVIVWRHGDALALVEGSAGWTFDRPSLAFADGSEVQIRLTLVWHLEDGLWRVVHSHASAGTG